MHPLCRGEMADCQLQTALCALHSARCTLHITVCAHSTLSQQLQHGMHSAQCSHAVRSRYIHRSTAQTVYRNKPSYFAQRQPAGPSDGSDTRWAHCAMLHSTMRMQVIDGPSTVHGQHAWSLHPTNPRKLTGSHDRAPQLVFSVFSNINLAIGCPHR